MQEYTHTHFCACDPHPDAHSKVEKKVGCYDNNVREAEGLRQVVEVGGGVRHPECLQQCLKSTPVEKLCSKS